VVAALVVAPPPAWTLRWRGSFESLKSSWVVSMASVTSAAVSPKVPSKSCSSTRTRPAQWVMEVRYAGRCSGGYWRSMRMSTLSGRLSNAARSEVTRPILVRVGTEEVGA